MGPKGKNDGLTFRFLGFFPEALNYFKMPKVNAIHRTRCDHRITEFRKIFNALMDFHGFIAVWGLYNNTYQNTGIKKKSCIVELIALLIFCRFFFVGIFTVPESTAYMKIQRNYMPENFLPSNIVP